MDLCGTAQPVDIIEQRTRGAVVDDVLAGGYGGGPQFQLGRVKCYANIGKDCLGQLNVVDCVCEICYDINIACTRNGSVELELVGTQRAGEIVVAATSVDNVGAIVAEDAIGERVAYKIDGSRAKSVCG